MKALSILLVVCALASVAAENAKPNTLSDEEKAAGWKLVFDGTTANGFRAIGKKIFPDKGWVVEDGTLKHQAKGGGGDIVINDPYENFEFSWEWKIPAGANSGVKYRVEDKPGSAFGPEFQLIDDAHADAKNRLHVTASLYEMFEPKEKKMKPAGEWNESRLLIQGNHVEHWLNGAKVVEYEFFNDAWNEAFAKSKYVKNPTFARTTKAYIALQDHGDETAFRSMKIRELPAK
jgi:hypothetical protein